MDVRHFIEEGNKVLSTLKELDERKKEAFPSSSQFPPVAFFFLSGLAKSQSKVSGWHSEIPHRDDPPDAMTTNSFEAILS